MEKANCLPSRQITKSRRGTATFMEEFCQNETSRRRQQIFNIRNEVKAIKPNKLLHSITAIGFLYTEEPADNCHPQDSLGWSKIMVWAEKMVLTPLSCSTLTGAPNQLPRTQAQRRTRSLSVPLNHHVLQGTAAQV